MLLKFNFLIAKLADTAQFMSSDDGVMSAPAQSLLEACNGCLLHWPRIMKPSEDKCKRRD